MSICNRLDLQTLGSQPIMMPKNLPNHALGKVWEEREYDVSVFRETIQATRGCYGSCPGVIIFSLGKMH